jgi:hypothetical protein
MHSVDPIFHVKDFARHVLNLIKDAGVEVHLVSVVCSLGSMKPNGGKVKGLGHLSDCPSFGLEVAQWL